MALAWLALALTASQAAPLPGNDATLLFDGPAAHKAMLDAIGSARGHVNLQTYILDEGEVADRFAHALAEKARAGIPVHLMYDAVGSLKTPKEYFERLREAGVRVCEFGPVRRLGKLNRRNHRKILVVDGRVAFTGGINVAETYASGSGVARAKPGQEKDEGWRDTQVRVAGPAAADFERLFIEAWSEQSHCTPMAERQYVQKVAASGDKTVQVVSAHPDRGSETYGALLDAIGAAKSRVWLTFGYFVPDPRMKQALLDAARRNVDVQLVLPGFSDFWAPVNAGRSHYEELLAAGVKIHEWHDALMHAKTAVIDSRWSSVGSTNLDWRSFVHNYEADLIVFDAAFAREMERRFRLDVKAAKPVDATEWSRRGRAQKVKEWIARQWEYLL